MLRRTRGLSRFTRRRSKLTGLDGGEGGIRTPGRSFGPYNGLANRRLQPLGHLSAVRLKSLTHCVGLFSLPFVHPLKYNETRWLFFAMNIASSNSASLEFPESTPLLDSYAPCEASFLSWISSSRLVNSSSLNCSSRPVAQTLAQNSVRSMASLRLTSSNAAPCGTHTATSPITFGYKRLTHHRPFPSLSRSRSFTI